MRLLLISTLALHGKFGGHGCGRRGAVVELSKSKLSPGKEFVDFKISRLPHCLWDT